MVQHPRNAKRRATRSSFPFFSNGAVGVLLSEPAPAWLAEESCRSLHTRVEMGAGRPVSSFTDVLATRDRLARRQLRGPGRLPGPGPRGSPAAFDLIAAAGRALDSFGVPGGWGFWAKEGAGGGEGRAPPC